MRGDYDVIVVGASFAGLAVASRLRGRMLLVDHQEIGAGQTSACAYLSSLDRFLKRSSPDESGVVLMLLK